MVKECGVVDFLKCIKMREVLNSGFMRCKTNKNAWQNGLCAVTRHLRGKKKNLLKTYFFLSRSINIYYFSILLILKLFETIKSINFFFPFF